MLGRSDHFIYMSARTCNTSASNNNVPSTSADSAGLMADSCGALPPLGSGASTTTGGTFETGASRDKGTVSKTGTLLSGSVSGS